MANKFEEKFNNLPYSTDWWERRCYILKLIVDMLDEFNTFQIYWTSLDENAKSRSRFILFGLEDTIYIWSDGFQKGLIECSQLDKVWNQGNNGDVMYSNLANAPVIYPMAMSAIYDNKLHRVYELKL